MSLVPKAIISVALLLIPLLLTSCSETIPSAFSADALSQFLNSGHLFFALGMTLMAGFLTALSPCVYPIIPITLSVIGARRYESAFQGFLVSLSYVSGMVFLYVGLGILFSSLGILFGGVFQSPIVLIIVATLFLFFALSMFGATNWLLPDGALKRLTAFGGSGFKGAFLMGLVSGLIASPCTGPVLAFILTLISQQGDMKTGSLLMFAFGIGMGLPFLLLGTFSSALSRIPKSGAWMNRIKMVFAIAMLITSVYFFNLGVRGLVGKTKVSNQDWLQIGENGNAQTKLHQVLKDAQENGTPVMIDFYADWCTACGELEKLTFKDPEVSKALSEFKLIRVDLTQSTESLDNVQQEFGAVGLPLIVFYDDRGNLLKQKAYGFMEPKAFLALLKQVKKRPQ